MSITLYVQDWNKQQTTSQKVYVKDEYPSIPNEAIPFYFSEEEGYLSDENGVYSIQKLFINPFPELNYSNHNFKLLLEALGYQFDYSGEFPVEQLQEVNSKIIRVINTQSINNATDTSYQNNNLIHLGQYIEAVKRKFNDILNLIQFAIKNNKSVYWG
tara:strand:- start:145 stop:618 length:474 start_codon:yes stop_codon:yes gene_type:complete